MGVKCIAYDPLLKEGDIINNIEIVSFDKLLKLSDFITVHVPLIESTYHL